MNFKPKSVHPKAVDAKDCQKVGQILGPSTPIVEWDTGNDLKRATVPAGAMHRNKLSEKFYFF